MNETFEVDGVTYKVRKPTNENYREAKKAYNRAFNDAVKSDSPLQAEATTILADRGLWSDKKTKEMEELYRDVAEQEYILHKGGIKKSEARAIAIKIRQLREKIGDLITPITNFNRHTAEGQAENAEYNYLASVCIVKDNDEPVFASPDDYLISGDKVAIAGSKKFAEMYYGIVENYNGTLIENQVLKELKFANDKYQLIDSKGRLIDEDGKLVDEKGRYIDEEGNLINVYGHLITETGELKGERGVFIDDEADTKKDSASS